MYRIGKPTLFGVNAYGVALALSSRLVQVLQQDQFVYYYDGSIVDPYTIMTPEDRHEFEYLMVPLQVSASWICSCEEVHAILYRRGIPTREDLLGSDEQAMLYHLHRITGPFEIDAVIWAWVGASWEGRVIIHEMYAPVAFRIIGNTLYYFDRIANLEIPEYDYVIPRARIVGESLFHEDAVAF